MMIVVCILIVAIFLLAYMMLQVYVKNQLFRYFENQDFPSYYALLDSTKAKLVIPVYNLEYMRFNGYFMQNRIKDIDRQFERLLAIKKNKAQTQALLQRGLQYYIDQKDSKKCHMILDLMKQYMEKQMVQEATCTVDIFVDGKWNYIESMEEQLRSADNEQKPVYLYLLQKQYENCHNVEKAKEYEHSLKEWKERNAQ